MTSKLIDRLAKLEGVRDARTSGLPMTPAMVQAIMVAVAVNLGGPGRTPLAAPLKQGGLTEAYARALDYANSGEMEASAECSPADWSARSERALAEALALKAPTGSAASNASSALFALMDDAAAAKTSGIWCRDNDLTGVMNLLRFGASGAGRNASA